MQRCIGRIRLDGRLAEQLPSVPVIAITSGEPGPTVALTANVHGDECGGTVALFEIDRWLVGALRRGKAVLYPTLNPAGLAARTRGIGVDGPDLNRLFPGDAGGNIGERLAFAIWREIEARQPSVLVDLHADSTQAIPYAIVDRAVALRGRAREELEGTTLALAAATGLTVLRDYPNDVYKRFALDRSLAGAMVNRAKVPAVTVEVGPRRIGEPAAVRTLVGAVRGVLRHLGMTDGPESEPHPTRLPAGPWRRSAGLRVRTEGVFVPSLVPGDGFETGDPIGQVRNTAGDVVELVRAEEPGRVISWTDTCWVTVGSSIGTFAVPERDR